MAEPVRFGLIGLGVNGSKHAEQLTAIADAALVAVADADPAKARLFAERYRVAGYDNYHDLLNRDDIDIVNICTPSGMHGDMAIDAARQGKHAIVEKPMDISLAKADAMIEAFEEAARKLCVISQHRFDPATVRLKEAMDRGELGDPLLGEAAVNWYRSQTYYDGGSWRGTWELDGGGALMNQSIHTIDIFQYLVGPVASVYTTTACLNHDRIQVEDVAVSVWRLANGGLASVVGTTLAYPGLPARIELFGSQGSAVLEGSTLTHFYKRPTDESQLRTRDRKAVNLAEPGSTPDAEAAGDPGKFPGRSHRLQMMDMIAAVRENRDPLVTGQEGRKPLELILAMYASARTGQPVPLPLSV